MAEDLVVGGRAWLWRLLTGAVREAAAAGLSLPTTVHVGAIDPPAPLLLLVTLDRVADVQPWAAHLGLAHPVLTANVHERDGLVWRTVRAEQREPVWIQVTASEVVDADPVPAAEHEAGWPYPVPRLAGTPAWWRPSVDPGPATRTLVPASAAEGPPRTGFLAPIVGALWTVTP